MSALVKIIKNPFNAEEETLKVKAKTRIKDIEGLDENNIIAFVNGTHKDGDYLLRNGDVCVIRQFPSNQKALEITLNFATFGLYTIADAIYKGVTGEKILDKYFAKNESLSNNDDDKITNLPSLAGSKNMSALGKKIPLVLGKTLFAPYILGLPYNKISGQDGKDQEYYCLYLIGYKDLQIENVSMGLDHISKNTGHLDNGNLPIDTDSLFYKNNTTLELRQGSLAEGGGEVSIYPYKVVQENLSIELKNVEGQTNDNYVTTSRYPKKVEIEFTIPALFGINKEKGTKTEASFALQVYYSLDAGTTWIMCENMIDFSQATGGSQWWELAGTKFYFFYNNKSETMRYVLLQTFSKSQMDNCDSKVVMYKIVRTTANSTDSSTADKCYVTAIRTWCYNPNEIVNGEYAYQIPMSEKHRDKTARLGIKLTVTDDVVSHFDKLNLIATSKARTWNGTGWSKTLSPTRNPVALALHALIGGFRDSYAYEFTENGDYIECPKIDLANFGEMYAICDETKQYDSRYDINKRYLCDGVVLNGTKTIDLVNSILRCCKSSLVMRGKKYGIFMDKPQAYPLFVLNNNNLLSLVYSKSFDEIPDGQYVKYISAINYYQQDTIAVKPVGSSQLSPTDKMVNVEYPYITDPYHAKALSLYQQACMKLRPESVNAKVTGEGGLAEIGSLIPIQSDVVLVGIGDGAEITEVVTSGNNITGIKTDGKFVVSDTSEDYGVVINVVGSESNIGKEKLLKIKLAPFSSTGEYSDLVFDTPIPASNVYKPEEGNIVSFGLYQKESIDMLCVGKKENGDGTYDLTLLPYDEAIYTADSQVVPDFDSKTTPPKSSGAQINFGDPTVPLTQKDIINIITDTKDFTPPPVPSSVSAKAYRDYIELRWAEEEHGNVKETVIELSKDGDQTTDESWVEVERRKTNTWNYYFDRTPTADGYPEASDLANYRFRMKNVSPNGIESSYCSYVTVNTNKYGTWLMPQTIRIQKEVIDRTVILTALYDQPKRGANSIELYGTVKTRVWISRKGNTDLIGNETFNDYLDVEPDTTGQGADIWYTPEFNEDVLPSSTEDTEKNYCHYENGQKATGEYVSNTYKVSHTLPLIGQNARLFDKDSQPIGMFSCDAVQIISYAEVTTVPQTASVGDLILFSGTTTSDFTNGKYYRYGYEAVTPAGSENPSTEGWYEKNGKTYVLTEDTEVDSEKTYYEINWIEIELDDVIHYIGESTEPFEEGKYYRYSEKEVQSQTVEYFEELLSKMVLVPTNYKYKLQMFIEESLSESNAETVVAQALCTNISDIVHSHEHYKDLYVEKLSAINANIGLISQGGMGTFDRNSGNYWALSRLSAEDSGVPGGMFPGEFRVGGTDQYFKVSIDPEDPNKYNIELRAGSISLSTETSRDGFVSGTYIYEKAPEKSFRRLHLTSTGIVVESRSSLDDTDWNNKVDEAEVTIDDRSNMIITNADKSVRPAFGFQVNGDIYHFDNDTDKDKAESGTNTQSLTVTGNCVNNGEKDDTAGYDATEPLLSTGSSPKSLFGDIVKSDLNNFTGNMVFFSKSSEVLFGDNDLAIKTDGSTDSTLPAPLTGYNEAMRTGGVGEDMGLTQQQIQDGIFY